MDIAGQLSLASKVDIASDHFNPDQLKRVAGIDISYIKDTDRAVVAGVIVDYDTLAPLFSISLETVVNTDYVPGFLALREMPAYRTVWKHLEPWCPDVVLVDGNGILHPRKCGSACYVGLSPTVGLHLLWCHITCLLQWLSADLAQIVVRFSMLLLTKVKT